MIRRFRLPGPRLLARLIARRAEALAGVSLTRPRPLDLAPRVAVPTLIVHGSNDALVALSDAQRLADAFLPAAPLIEVAGCRGIPTSSTSAAPAARPHHRVPQCVAQGVNRRLTRP